MEKIKKLILGLFMAIMLVSFPASEMLPQIGTIRVEAASISKKTAKLNVGKTTTLKIKGAKGKVKWKSSNTKVATVSSKGKVTGKKAGTATITATVNKKSYSCKVTVVQKVTKVKLNKSKITLALGRTYQLKTTLSPKGITSGLKWKSSKTKYATVNQSGLVTAKKKGTTTITVTATDGSKKKATCKVTVKDIRVQKLSVSGKSALTVGETAKLTAKTTPSNANNLFTWKSSNSGVVTVSKSGEIVAKKAGTATITVTATDKSKKTATIKIVVNKKVVETEKVDTTPETEKQTESETPSETLPDDSATMDPTESSGGTTETEGTLDEDDTEKVTEKETESETQKQTETETEKQTETESETPSETETESETKQTESETEVSSDDYSYVKDKSLSGGRNTTFDIYTDKSADCFSVTTTGNSVVVTGITEGTISGDHYVSITLRTRLAGSSTVSIKCNGVVKASCTITVTSNDSNYINYTTWKEKVKSKIWSEGMNDIAKLTAIGDYICQNYDYDASNWDYYCFASGYGGDCYAASHLICDFANDLGLTANVDHVYGVATHVCAVVKINGAWYSFDAGTNDTAGNRACLVKIVS